MDLYAYYIRLSPSLQRFFYTREQQKSVLRLRYPQGTLTFLSRMQTHADDANYNYNYNNNYNYNYNSNNNYNYNYNYNSKERTAATAACASFER